MLHILLLVLKIIGIILAIILGILLILVGIILFVPVRYEITAKCNGTMEDLKAKVNATWFLHLVRADLFLKGKKLKWQVRFAWLKKSNQKKKESVAVMNQKEEKKDESEAIKPEKEHNKVEETAANSEKPEQSAEISEEKCETSEDEFKKDRLEECSKDINKKSETDSEGDETTFKKSKIESVIKKIKISVKNICDKIKDLLQKKDKITEFLTDDAHIRAFKKAKKELYILLKKLKPKKTNIKLRFGFEDPATTGKVLGGLSILYPFLGEITEITPDFENQVLKGTVYLNGKIRFCHFAGMLLNLVLCKDIRSSYKDIRNFKL